MLNIFSTKLLKRYLFPWTFLEDTYSFLKECNNFQNEKFLERSTAIYNVILSQSSQSKQPHYTD